MKRLMLMLIILKMVLQDMGAVTGVLDSISPESFVDLIDNPDGTYTIIWEEGKEYVESTKGD